MEGFDKINKFYISATGEQLASKIDHAYYRQDDTVSMPISPIIRGGEENDKWHNCFVEAIQSNTFSVKQTGQIYTPTNKEITA